MVGGRHRPGPNGFRVYVGPDPLGDVPPPPEGGSRRVGDCEAGENHRDQMGVVARLKMQPQRLDVLGDGMAGEAEVAGDLAVAQAFGKELHDRPAMRGKGYGCAVRTLRSPPRGVVETYVDWCRSGQLSCLANFGTEVRCRQADRQFSGARSPPLPQQVGGQPDWPTRKVHHPTAWMVRVNACARGGRASVDWDAGLVRKSTTVGILRT